MEVALTDHISIRVLGPVRVLVDGEPLEGLSPQGQALLARLALSVGQVVNTDQLIDTMWLDNPPATARKSIQKGVSEIRKRMGADVIESAPSGYRLNLRPAAVDAVEFETLISRADVGEGSAALELLDDALALWDGEPIAGPGEGFEPWRTRLAEQRVGAVESRAALRLQLAEAPEVVGELEELVQRHPLRERLWGLLMMALYQAGRQADALRAYQRISQILGDQLGIEPSLELRDLELRIIQQDPALVAVEPRAQPGNLPRQLTSFVGRNADLDALAALVDYSPLVTLVGPGGSGKTRLAIETGARIRGGFADGVWFVDLGLLTSGDQLAVSMTETLGLAEQSSLPAETVLVEHLAKRCTLILLDNCEHVVDVASSLTGRLLRSAERLRILATSREPLDLGGETIYDVEPLGVPESGEPDPERYESVRLFAERAQSVDRHFALTADNASAIAEICRKLDGMPLAIELAAARVRAFDPAHLAGLLDDRFTILVSSARDAAHRHQTLRATVQWSYELLSLPHRVLFRRMSVFRGGCDLAATQRICATDPLADRDVLSLLPELVDKSLVLAVRSPGRPTRYRLLETLRQFGEELLTDEEAAELGRFHAEHFTLVAEELRPHLRGAGQRAAIEDLGLDYDNIREALVWSFDHDAELAVRLAVALAEYWDVAGPRLIEAQSWIERAVVAAHEVESELRVACLVAASDLFVSTKLSVSVGYASAALQESRARGDEAGEARALRALAWARGLSEHVPEALSYGRSALEIFRRLDDPWEIALCLERLGQTDFEHADEALDYLSESLTLYREVGDRRRAAMVLYKMTDRAMQAMADLDQAQQWAEEAVTILSDMGSVQHTGHALLELGRITRRRGYPTEAATILRDALDRLQQVGDKRCTVRTLGALGTALTDAGDAHQAYSVLADGLERGRDLGERQVLRVPIAALGRLLARSARTEDATTLLAIVDKLGDELRISVAPAVEGQRRGQLEELHAQLGDDAYEAAWQRGVAMSLADAADFAIRMCRRALDER